MTTMIEDIWTSWTDIVQWMIDNPWLPGLVLLVTAVAMFFLHKS